MNPESYTTVGRILSFIVGSSRRFWEIGLSCCLLIKPTVIPTQIAGRPGGLSTSGSPRMLPMLVREFEYRRGEILNLFAKKKEKKINC